MFVTFLRYKLDEQGKKLVKVVQALKPVMFVVTKETKKLSVREWDCPECSTHHDRDVSYKHLKRGDAVSKRLATP